MRSYRQFCPLARTLDVIGERWTVLILRELFARDSRYADLRDSLPGIASNLLADRLRHLQTDGLVETYTAPRPVHATLYRLTPRGRELEPALRALASWGAPLIADGQGQDAFRTHWMTLGLTTFFEGADSTDLAPLTVHIHTGDEPATLQVTDSGLTLRTGTVTTDEAVVLTGGPDEVVAMLTGATVATPSGVTIHGPQEMITRLHTLTSRVRSTTTPDAPRSENLA